jgi:hypothetical protein
MKTLITFAISCLFSLPALAISDAELAQTCASTGEAKLTRQAEAYGCQVDAKQMTVEEIDNRMFNPSKYVWYKVDQPCGEFDQLVVMVQYYRGRCF